MPRRDASLSRKPALFKAMTGVTVALFDEVVWDVWDLGPAYAAAQGAAGAAAGGGGRAPLPALASS